MKTLVKVAQTIDIPEGLAISVEVEGNKIAIFNVKGKYYAIDDACTHEGGPLSDGDVEGTVVTCPWHGSQFNILNGEVLDMPALEGVRCYKVFIEGDDIKIEI